MTDECALDKCNNEVKLPKYADQSTPDWEFTFCNHSCYVEYVDQEAEKMIKQFLHFVPHENVFDLMEYIFSFDERDLGDIMSRAITKLHNNPNFSHED